MTTQKSLLQLIALSTFTSLLTISCTEPQTTSQPATRLRSTAMENWEKALEWEFKMLRNPQTGSIPEGIRDAELLQAKRLQAAMLRSGRTAVNSYTFQGPENLGGRVRTVVYDKRYNGSTNRIILAGGVSGGVFKSIDDGATWTRKSPTSDHYSCTSIAQDKRVGFEDTWYYSTGEALGNSASGASAFYLGNGIYKSVDNGETWTKLAASNTGALETFDSRLDLISKVAVDSSTGHVYAAATAAIYRSTDGGTTWTAVLTSSPSGYSSSQKTDIVIHSSGGRFYAAFSGTSPTSVDGVWSSTTGASGSWTKIAGTGSATTPAGWNAKDAYRRVVLALAPNSQDSLYVLYAKSTIGTCAGTPSPEAEFFRWRESTDTWTDLSANLPDEAGCLAGNDPFAVQGGYDLLVDVKPDDASIVFVGGTNLYRSTSGFTSTAATTRIGGYATAASYSLYAASHPDIHAMAFQPGSPSILICGNDGGLQRTTDITAGTVAWTNISSGFRTYQFYYATLDPRSGNAKVMGGTQDNGTARNVGGTGTTFETVFGGDGVSVGLSDEIGGLTYEYVGFQLGEIYRRSSALASGFGTYIKPASVSTAGLFVTLFHLDQDNTEILYYANENRLLRTASASTVTTGTWTEFSGVPGVVGVGKYITALATSRGTYSAATSSLFIGTDGAKVFRIDAPATVGEAVTPVDISGAFPTGGYVSSIAVNPRNDDTVLVTFSNYGVASAFWTGTANSATPTWYNVEGTLPLPSYRSSAIVVNSPVVEYYVGTSVGLYRGIIDGSSSVTASSTAWVQEGTADIGNAVVGHLAHRWSDNVLLAGTHGLGMWRSVISSGTPLPVTIESFTGTVKKYGNVLNWRVSNEEGNKGFYIERKQKDDMHFSPIGFIAAKAKAPNGSTYMYADETPNLASEETFYRLKQVDYNGQFSYSPVVVLKRVPSGKLVEYISADRNKLMVRMNYVTGDNITIMITDAGGKVVHRQTGAASTKYIAIDHLAGGMYIAQVYQGNRRAFTQQFIK